MTTSKNNLPSQRQQQRIDVVLVHAPFALSSTRTTSALSDENYHGRAFEILPEALEILEEDDGLFDDEDEDDDDDSTT